MDDNNDHFEVLRQIQKKLMDEAQDVDDVDAYHP